ncbi:MAG: DM13 domain-containing protein [Pseudomonadales bacterium]|nr:DM13 domain-containing protein [Pseudomonadales bacterium]
MIERFSSLGSWFGRVLLFGLVSLLGQQSALAGNLYDTASGDLVIPIIRLEDNTAYMAIFQRVSEEPPVWGASEFTPVSVSSRTEGVYTEQTASLWVPEINVGDVLYSLNFNVTQGCGFDVCLQADAESVVNNGRYGAAVYTTPLSSGSTFSCSSCHAMTEEDGFASDGFRRPGHPLKNANLRTSYKNGQFTEFLDAVNTCVTEWMNSTALEETDTDWINLLNWLQDQNDSDSAELVEVDIVEPPVNVVGGDVENGRDLFNTRCIVCHGFDGEGTQLAPKITGFDLSLEYIAQRTRTSGLTDSSTYSGLTGGVMPFWGSNRLSDPELLDIVAFVSTGAESGVMMANDDPLVNTETGCTSTSSKIGQTAALSTLFHAVSGTATIIDDCTIDLTDFRFDGGGIDVRIYVGNDGRFFEREGGFAISGDLVGISYFNNTLRLTLPPDRTLDDFNSISVWCVAVGVSFGTGFFN